MRVWTLDCWFPITEAGQGRLTVQVLTLPPAPVHPRLLGIVVASGEHAALRFLEFFAANIRNPHTRRAYARAAGNFLGWCEAAGVRELAAVQPLHVAAWVEGLGRVLAAPPSCST